MNRRAFFGTLAAGLTLDPEKLLWRPGRKLISIPAPARWTPLNIRILRTYNFEWDPLLAFHPDCFSMVWPPLNSK